MSNPVAQRIIAEARRRADRELAKAREEGEVILAETTAAAEAEAATIAERAEEQARQKAEGIGADARLSVRLAELRARQALIAAVIDEALLALQGLPDERYREVALRQIEENHFAGEQELVVCPEDGALWNGAFVDRINRALGSTGRVALVTDGSIESRTFVLRQGRKSVECGARSALRSRREEIEGEVVKVLFGEQGG